MTARLVLIAGGLGAWFIACFCILLVVGPAYWVINDPSPRNGLGPMEMLGIRIEQILWIYFPVLAAVAILTFIVGAREIRDAVRWSSGGSSEPD